MTRLLAEQSFEMVEKANEFISQFVGTKDIPLPERELPPLERAQDKMYEAWGVARPVASPIHGSLTYSCECQCHHKWPLPAHRLVLEFATPKTPAKGR